jgi:hypothetical protein
MFQMSREEREGNEGKNSSRTLRPSRETFSGFDENYASKSFSRE